jgi:predicted outer membrane repeat protein
LEVLETRDCPSTLTVTNNLDGYNNPGDLRQAVLLAQGGDTIVFDSSLKGQTITLYDGELYIQKNVTIQGPGAGFLAVSGGNSSRVFEVAANTAVTLSGLTITGGIGQGLNDNGWGGGILNFGTLTVSGCTVSNNSVGFLANSADHLGGGIYNAGMLTVTASTVSGNSAGYVQTGVPGNTGVLGSGGGLYNVGTLAVTGSTLSGNSATYQGGAICNTGTVTVSASALSGNSAADGGGIFNYNTATISSSTLSGNSASSDGGGIFNYNTTTISSSTLSGNSAADGGGIFNYNTVTISSSTLSGNSATDGGGIFNNKHAQLTITSKSDVCNNTATVGADLFDLGSTKISKDSTVCVIGH